MKLNGLTAVLLLAGLPLCSIASPYQTLARDAESSARWGLLGSAAEQYRAILADPSLSASHPRARLALAKVHADALDYPAAKAELARLKQDAPDSAEAKEGAKLAKRIARKLKTHTFGGRVAVARVHDTDTANASAGMTQDPSFDDEDDEDEDMDDMAFEDDDSLDDLLDDIDLDEDDLADDGEEDDDTAPTPVAKPKSTVHDNRWQAAGSLRYGYGFDDRGSRWNLGANIAQARQDDRDELNRQTWAVSTGPTFVIPAWRLKLNAAVTYLQLYKDHQYDLSSTIWSLGASHKLNRVLELYTRYNYENRGLENDSPLDIDVDTFKVGTRFKPTGKDSFDLSYSPKVEDNDTRNKDKEQEGWKISYARKLPWDSFASVAYSRRHTDFEHDPSGKEEDETKHVVTLGHTLTKDLVMTLSYEHKDKDSNLPGRDKNNESTALGLSYKF
ncbi:hypothetical protein PSGK_26510 [Pseudomonas solani]|uniref:hypothetical protein n=1 Tax=Pseudomonas solani TaxID=2731552 RepID=UPI0035BE6901